MRAAEELVREPQVTLMRGNVLYANSGKFAALEKIEVMGPRAMSMFIPVNDNELTRLIHAARRRIVIVAPGVSAQVADALGKRVLDRPAPDITVVIDPDEEVCRIG